MHHIFIAGLTAVTVAALAWLISRLRPRRLDGDAGTIVPERWTAAFTVLGGLAFAAVGVLALLAGDWMPGLACILMGLACAGFMAPSLTDFHRVRWTAEGVEGPSRMFGPTLGIARAEIAWREVAMTGKTITGYWFIQADDGRRIYWSYLYRGFGAFVASLVAHCPNVELPEDLR